MEDVIIIGAGLSGLSTAYQLKKRDISFKVLQAQNRLCSRIETIYGNQKIPMEMGVTWFSQEHKNILELLTELTIDHFELHTEEITLFETMSFEPPPPYFVLANTNTAYRVRSRTYSIIASLYKNIGAKNIVFNTQIIKVQDDGDLIPITDRLQNNFFCKQLIVATPPKLLINSIQFFLNCQKI